MPDREALTGQSAPTPTWEVGRFELSVWWPLPVEGGHVSLKAGSDRLALTGENLRQLAEIVDGIGAFREDVGRGVDLEPDDG